MHVKFEAFVRITSRWHLTNSERRALLGSPTDERWFQLMRGGSIPLSAEEFERVQWVIAIDGSLSECLKSPTDAAQWFRTLSGAAPFSGRTPLALLFRGTEGFRQLAEYLEARRPHAESPAQG
jgi:hypothetical protein